MKTYFCLSASCRCQAMMATISRLGFSPGCVTAVIVRMASCCSWDPLFRAQVGESAVEVIAPLCSPGRGGNGAQNSSKATMAQTNVMTVSAIMKQRSASRSSARRRLSRSVRRLA